MTTTSGKGPMGPGGGSRAPRAGEVDGAPEADASSGDGTPGDGPGAGRASPPCTARTGPARSA
ncbi:hypothetical protein WY02_02455 [Pseudonocardia sp. AL041005-10]|nr:hypothetical protein [Pseudonocardia sp. AL041005-10]ALE77502.1 hypothetical protein WY02_02455 [Pseudonocardia sp. AL041005-10]